ncbi:MAG: bifunctional folylpolyglutamate synthase/dihydrofolate synthase [Kiritimatiellae bacterium]|nr:bifunctional folylpolyglutamate synthase/dihydrofolate synthase [Kiritimatiellia bacterium]
MKKSELQLKIDRLFKRQRFGIKMGLDIEPAILALLDNPERAFPVIHIAGTNGKGSTSAIVSSILSKAGYKVGLYTSPHLVTFNERFKVDAVSITDEDLGELVSKIESVASEVNSSMGQEPTFFECATAMAFEHFKRNKVDIAVVETGMGGRLDATNVVLPLISVITRISLEHTQYLGDTLAAIAFEKAGIIKEGRPVVVGAMDDEALDLIKRTAKERGSPCLDSAEHASIRSKSTDLTGQKITIDTNSYSYGTVKFPLLGKFQLENLATAISVIDTLRDVIQIKISEEAVKSGVASAVWPGRCQVIKSEPPVLIDGAHNPDAAKALAEVLKDNAAGRPVGLIVGMCGDKDPQQFLQYLSRITARLWIVPIDNERNMPPKMILNAATAIDMPATTALLPEAMQQAESWAEAENGIVCVTGSLFLVGDVLRVVNS